MTTVNPSPVTAHTVELSPSYTIPLVLVAAAIPVLALSPWIGLGMALFGLFLMFQALTIRLKFTETALAVYRSEKLIRNFPYNEWQNWRIFWHHIPILFYFKEVKSIHFLPIIFDAKLLKACLEKYYPLDRSSG